MAAAQPLVFDAELDTVRERLGSVKGVSYDTAMGVRQLTPATT